MNNKGFAITTLIYGLSILGIMLIMLLMSTLSATRYNNRELSNTIETELNRFSKTSIVFGYKSELQEFTVPPGEAGWYRIELWGAQGGTDGGYGAYTTGIIHLNDNDTLYFKVGKAGGDNTKTSSTDVRLETVAGEIDSYASLGSRIMVAAGGSLNTNSHGGTLCGYGPEMNTKNGKIRSDFELEDQSSTGTLLGTPATYKKTLGECTVKMDNSTNRLSNSSDIKADGYYYSNNKSYGGISFISGYLGGYAIVKGVKSNSPTYKHYEYSEGYTNVGGTPYYFVDGLMLPGVKQGAGKASIEKIISETEDVKSLPRKNTKLNKVKKIIDCISSPYDGESTWQIVGGMAKGEAIGKMEDGTKIGGNGAVSTSGGKYCYTFTLNNPTDLDDVVVRHKAGYDYVAHEIKVEYASGSSSIIKGATTRSQTETITGTRISAYQPDMTQPLPDMGNYYVFSVLSDNTVLSAFKEAVDDSNPLFFEFLQGENRQKWSIEEIKGKLKLAGKREFKLVELTRYKALEIYLDENKEKNKIAATENFNVYQRNEPQIWQITPRGDGTYTISTIVATFKENVAGEVPTGNIILNVQEDRTQFGDDLTSNYNHPLSAIIGKQVPATSRFWFYSIDYSSK